MIPDIIKNTASTDAYILLLSLTSSSNCVVTYAKIINKIIDQTMYILSL